ncbi:FG-GAP repeat domain-containing protein [Aliiroseovarius crassostreae]|uniref:FG-GAP repeat domain-containing protein n=1 Tax=Aliiroseovarius crassostreae TaxID=154981 RepID=UPI003C7BF060
MSAQAPRLPARLWRWGVRGVVLAMALVAGQAAVAERITEARFSGPTARYPHGVLGDDLEWGQLLITTDVGGTSRLIRMTLPDHRVFEDLTPRLVDLDGDQSPEVLVVESDAQKGAQLAIYDQTGKIAATPFIGTRFRWLAPIGAADLDGDGHVEIAYIDRPHLVKTLRVWRLERDGDGASLTEIASKPGLTNHKIGQDFITGGIRDCGDGPQMVTVDASWQNIMVTRLASGKLSSRALAPFDGTASIRSALSCQN